MFWSSQMLSLTEFCAGSSVSTLTAFAITSVSTVALRDVAAPRGRRDRARRPTTRRAPTAQHQAPTPEPTASRVLKSSVPGVPLGSDRGRRSRSPLDRRNPSADRHARTVGHERRRTDVCRICRWPTLACATCRRRRDGSCARDRSIRRACRARDRRRERAGARRSSGALLDRGRARRDPRPRRAMTASQAATTCADDRRRRRRSGGRERARSRTAVERFGELDVLVNDAAAYPDALDARHAGRRVAPGLRRQRRPARSRPDPGVRAPLRSPRAEGGAIVNITTGSVRSPRPRGRRVLGVEGSARDAVEGGRDRARAARDPRRTSSRLATSTFAAGATAFPDRASDELRDGWSRSIPLGRAGVRRTSRRRCCSSARTPRGHITGAVLDVDGGSLAGRFTLPADPGAVRG